MDKMQLRIEITKQSIERIKSINFGDPITNICAGEGNPTRHSYFSRIKNKVTTNRFGIKHTERLVECTNKKGKFWVTNIDVIHSGHLDFPECAKLFLPV